MAETVVPVKNGNAGQFGPGNSGRPKGAKNKTTQLASITAREAFSHLVGPVLKAVSKHLKEHTGKEDCATCRHAWDVVLGYNFGKPTQRVEVDVAAVRARAREVAERLGLDPDRVMEVAERGLALDAG